MQGYESLWCALRNFSTFEGLLVSCEFRMSAYSSAGLTRKALSMSLPVPFSKMKCDRFVLLSDTEGPAVSLVRLHECSQPGWLAQERTCRAHFLISWLWGSHSKRKFKFFLLIH